MTGGDDKRDDDDDDDLGEFSSMRGMFASARESVFDEEPGPRVDALLMAAARQHAPKPRAAWWERLADWMRPAFAHPALAGAAALVIVGGAAGVMYRRGQHKVVQPTPHAAQVATRDAAKAPPPSAALEEQKQQAPVTPPSFGAAVPPPAEVTQPEPLRARVTPPPTIERRSRTPGSGSGAGGDAGGDALDGTASRSKGGLMIATGPSTPDVRDPDPNRWTENDGADEDQAEVAQSAAKPKDDVQAADDQVASAPPPPPRVSGATSTATSEALSDAKNEGRDQTTALFNQARTAARAEQCDVVKTIAARVKKLDATYYRDVFARDVEIARCL